MHNSAHLEAPIAITGDAKRYDTGNEDNFTQCGIFWNHTLTEQGRHNLIENMSGHLINAEEFIQQRAVNNFAKCDPEYGRRLQEALNKLKATRSSVI